MATAVLVRPGRESNVVHLRFAELGRAMVLVQRRAVQTSAGKKDEELVLPTMVDKDFPLKKEVEKMVEEETKNWVSIGVSLTDRDADVVGWNWTCFALCTLFTWFVFVWYYTPTPSLNDWARREAYLELERRESRGLPLIDANMIDPKRVELPTDEELGDFELLI
jgi:NADH dehydrogenase (ubiquinone) 1 beta subcomplex subunit 11